MDIIEFGTDLFLGVDFGLPLQSVVVC